MHHFVIRETTQYDNTMVKQCVYACTCVWLKIATAETIHAHMKVSFRVLVTLPHVLPPAAATCIWVQHNTTQHAYCLFMSLLMGCLEMAGA